MALKIIWTANALEDYKRVIDYLVEEWSAGIAERFSENVQARLETLSNYPFLGIASTQDLSVRSISVSKHNRLYYRVTSSSIEVLDIFDTRQNPKKKTSMIDSLFFVEKINRIIQIEHRYLE